jgi:phospholipid/cholesterol/gamma-HCH transport system substrate-binding protein
MYLPAPGRSVQQPQLTERPGVTTRRSSARVAVAVALVAAAAIVGYLMFVDTGGDYTVKARFQNAGQVVRGGLVEIAGQKVGTVKRLRLTDDGVAELELAIDEEWAPLPKGTHAQIRQFGLSGPASRYIDLRYPPDRDRAEDIEDGGVIDQTDTTSNVDLDEVFTIFDKNTREGLRKVFRGSNRQYTGQAKNFNEGVLYLDPALVSASRLFRELNRDTGDLERFITESSDLVGDIADRRDDLAGLISNLSDTTGAISRPRGPSGDGALADAIRELPGFMRQANTTYVNLRATLDDLDPLVTEFKPVAKRLVPYTAEVRELVQDLDPAVRDLSVITTRRGPDNDLIDLSRLTLPLRDIAVGPVRRNGATREGTLPAAAEALTSATPRVAFARPYSFDFTGWLDDFSHTGNVDALGGFSRAGSHVSAFSFKTGLLQPIAPAARAQEILTVAQVNQRNKCPGASERDSFGDGSLPWKPYPEFNCNLNQTPLGP